MVFEYELFDSEFTATFLSKNDWPNFLASMIDVYDARGKNGMQCALTFLWPNDDRNSALHYRFAHVRLAWPKDRPDLYERLMKYMLLA